MNNIQLFNYESNDIRVIEINGEPWFVGRDIANILGYKNPSEAVKDHTEEEDRLNEQIASGGQNRDMIVVNESGLYSLVLSSKLETAKQFKRWITSEVIPSIRKQGYYIAPTNNQDILLNALSQLTSKINLIETNYISQVNYLTESNKHKDNLIEEHQDKENKLNEVFTKYPGLKEAINYYLDNLDNDDEEGFSLNEYLKQNRINLDRGMRIQVGQLVSAWTKLSSNQEIIKVNGYLYYQQKHLKLLVIAIRYVQNLI